MFRIFLGLFLTFNIESFCSGIFVMSFWKIHKWFVTLFNPLDKNIFAFSFEIPVTTTLLYKKICFFIQTTFLTILNWVEQLHFSLGQDKTRLRRKMASSESQLSQIFTHANLVGQHKFLTKKSKQNSSKNRANTVHWHDF